ncbi:MAG: tetratricopeptide repeat protein [Candidatus Acidiferrales bacterium]
MIIRNSFAVKGILAVALVMFAAPARPAAAQAAQEQSQAKTSYTIPEYNAFQAARAEKDASARIKLLDDFVSKFPNSTLLPYVYELYYPTYNELKDYPHAIEYADKVIALGDKVDAGARLQAIQVRCQVFPAAFNAKAADAHDQLVKERDAAKQGAQLLETYPKPANLSDEQFAQQKKPGLAFFYSSAGFADLQLKDYPAAIASFKSALTNNPNDAVSWYRLGLCYLSSAPAPAATPAPAPAASATAAAPAGAAPTAAAPASADDPMRLDGFWALARAINLKIPGDAQVKDYLKKQILAYEQPGCDSLADAQLNELLTLAGTTGDRPASYKIPSAADLNAIRSKSNILTVVSDLQGGGDTAKNTWLAICGAEFPDVVGKIIDVQPGDGVTDFMAYTGATQDDMEKATVANMDVKVLTALKPGQTPPTTASGTQIQPQPDVSRLAKDDGVEFSGTLVSFDPTPFILHWDLVKVDPSSIPAKADEGKHHKLPPKKGSGK